MLFRANPNYPPPLQSAVLKLAVILAVEVVDEDGRLMCKSTKLNQNGYWKIIVQGMCISLRNSNNYWLTAWKGELRASGLHPGEYSRFRVFPRPTYRGDLGC